MSTIAYAALTTTREKSPPNKSTSSSPPGVNTYVDALAALVPAEVLALHGLILSATTKTVQETTEIVDPITLRWSFLGLVILSVILYIVPRCLARKWDRWDFLRMFIPAFAFVGWTMLQRATAFDAVLPSMTEGARTAIALFLGVILGLVAAILAYKADQKETKKETPKDKVPKADNTTDKEPT
jgi:hypothetical protein